MQSVNFFNNTASGITVLCALLFWAATILFLGKNSYQKGMLFTLGAMFFYLLAGVVEAAWNSFADLGISDEVFIFTFLFISLFATGLLLWGASYIWQNAPAKPEYAFAFISLFLVVALIESFVFQDFQELAQLIRLLPVCGFLFVAAAFLFKPKISFAQVFSALVFGAFSVCFLFYSSALVAQSFLMIAAAFAGVLLKLEQAEQKNNLCADVLARTVFNVEALPLPAFVARAQNGQLIMANSAAEKVFHLAVNELPRYHFADVFADEKSYNDVLQKLEKNKHVSLEFLAKTAGGTVPFWVLGTVDEVFYDEEKAYYAVLQEALVRKKIEETDLAKEEIDLLSGARQAANFQKKAQNQIKLLKKNKKSYALILLDVQNFKQINLKFGTKTGDQVLIETASVLRKLFEPEALVGRVGADAFGVFTAVENLDQTLHKLMLKLKKCVVFASLGQTLHFDVAIGAAESKENDFALLFEKAFKALQNAQKKKTDPVEIFKGNAGLKGVRHKMSKQIHPVFSEEEHEISLLDDGEFSRLPEE